MCPLRFLLICVMRRLGNVQSFKTYMFRFWAFCHERDSGWAGHPTLIRLHGKLPPRLTGLPYLADRATRLGGSPHLSCKRDQDEIRNYMDRRVTSPTWGPPPPCKRAHNCGNWNLGTLFIRFSLIFHEKMPYTCEIRQVWRAEKGSWKYVKTSRLLFNYFLGPK